MRGWRQISRWTWCWCWGWWRWWRRCDGDAPSYAKEESMVLMEVISLRWLQQISPSGCGRRVPPPSLPQKIMGKIGHPFSVKTKAYIRRRMQCDHRGPNETWWHDLPAGPRHLGSFWPHGSSRLLQYLQLLLVIKYWCCNNPRSNWGPEGPWNIKIRK
jgi:hypothetical protein